MANGNRPGLAIGTPQPQTTVQSGGQGGVVEHNVPPPQPTHDTGFRGASLAMTPKQVRSMQQFLHNHGFQVALDGKYGPQTADAAKAYRTNHKGGAAWSAKNGIGTHPVQRTTAPSHDPAAGTVPPASTTPASTAPGGVDTNGAFGALLKQLLAQGGNVGTMFNPNALGDAAAAPSDALATTLARQAQANPLQEKQSQADISNWYGLDPHAAGYSQSVLARLQQAGARDQTAASDAAGNSSDLAAKLAGSIGGAANDGSSTVAAAGADAAGTANALGTVAKQYADDMNPILTAEARGQMSREHASNSQTLLQLQDQLAQAKGQATADRTSAFAGGRDKNNALGQQRFANKGNLLSTLAQMAAVDPQSGMLDKALTAAKVNNLNAKTQQILTGKTTAGKTYKIDVAKSTQGIINHLGYTVNPSGQPVVPTADHTRLAKTIGAFLTANQIQRGDPNFKKIGDAIFAGFVDQHGRPLVAPPNWAI